jgi:hypothetical protein
MGKNSKLNQMKLKGMDPKYIYPPEFEIVSCPTMTLPSAAQFDILSKVQDQASKAIQEQEDYIAIQWLKAIGDDTKEQFETVGFPELCAKIRKKYGKKEE